MTTITSTIKNSDRHIYYLGFFVTMCSTSRTTSREIVSKAVLISSWCIIIVKARTWGAASSVRSRLLTLLCPFQSVRCELIGKGVRRTVRVLCSKIITMFDIRIITNLSSCSFFSLRAFDCLAIWICELLSVDCLAEPSKSCRGTLKYWGVNWGELSTSSSLTWAA